MTFVLGTQHTEPLPVQVSQGWKGDMLLQVLGGPGVWIGTEPVSLKNFRAVDAAPEALLDGLYIAPGDGPQFIPWRGPCYLYHPGSATSTVYGSIQLMGCVE